MKEKKYNLYVDFDTVLFRKIKGLQKDYIEVEYQNNGRKKVFKNVTEFRGGKKVKIEGWLGETNTERKEKGLRPFLLKDFSVVKKAKIIASDEKAKDSLKQNVEFYKNLSWVKDLKLIVGGENCFRYDIYKEYKANRDPKPLRFVQIKKWFCEEFSNIITIAEGCESDDYLNIAGWHFWEKEGEDSDFCAGYIDKDCDQFPGFRWNYDKNKFYFINEFKAHYNLCVQCLVGDKSTDNIPSVPAVNDCMQKLYPIGLGGIGPAKAKLILKGCKTIPELYREVEEIYKCYYDDNYKEPLNLTYRLVHLLEKKKEIKDFPWQL